LGVDVLVAETTETSQAAQHATTTVPIVFVAVGDPVAAKLVTNLAHPGANITGFSQSIVESAGKRLEMLKTVMPDLTEVSVLWKPEDVGSTLAWQEIQGSSARLGLHLRSLTVTDNASVDKALAAALQSGARALYLAPDPLLVTNESKIAAFARQHRMASVFHLPDFVRAGGLLSFGPDRADLFRRAAGYVDRILKGAKPGDLPVEQPIKFVLSVNLGTARAIGVTPSLLLLTQADEVVE
jgi:putative ABC transport system substrate-binding protein